MTLEEAKKILHPDTTFEALAEIEYYGGFNGGEAKVKACDEACLIACEAIDKVLAGQWISVKDRLPEADFEEYFRINSEYPHYLVKIREGVTACILDYNGKEWVDDYYTPYTVTHWMPLPEPPKEDRLK